MTGSIRTLAAGLAAVALVAGLAPQASGHGVPGGPLGPQQVDGPAGTLLDAATQAWCDPIDPHACLLPFPNDHFTRRDRATDTGRRLDLNPLAMPRNLAGKPIDPTEWNRNDGFSPGQLVVTKVPGIDVAETRLPPITDPGFSLSAPSAVVAIDTATGRRHPLWAELDSTVDGRYAGGEIEQVGLEFPESPPLHDPDNGQALLIRPARNWEEGHRYVVVLLNMRGQGGAPLPSSEVFAAYRDGEAPLPVAFEARRAHFEQLFAEIAGHHGPPIDRDDVYLAWDFTVASERNLAERLLHMRDDSFRTLGDDPTTRGTFEGAPPAFEVTSVENNPSANVYRRVQGRFDVPRYVSTPAPGARMVYDPTTGLPLRQPTAQSATFTCNIPTGPPPDFANPHNPPGSGPPASPTGVSLYGHGLLGGQGEVNSDAEVDMGAMHNWTFCATDWIGMASEDLPVIVAVILTDLSNFHLIPDRFQQGILDFLWLGRLLKDPRAFAAHPAFQDGDGQTPGEPLIDPASLVYYGNSQGAIGGGAVTAVAQDFERAVLGVGGMNYSTLLRRSKDFDAFAALLYPNYADELDRSIIISLMQTLWDRGESNGYAHHATDDPYDDLAPFAATPPHRILMEAGFGDHQVTNYALEVQAATYGAAAHVPVPARHWGRPAYGWFDTVSAPGGGGDVEYPYAGSVMIEWDSGTAAPPLDNTPNRANRDPHESPRRDIRVRDQMNHFWRTGVVKDVCSASSADGTCQISYRRDGPH